MQALKVVLGLVVLVAIAALAVVVALPDRLGEYVPFMRSGPGQGGPYFVIEVEPDGVELSKAVDDSIWMIERRFSDLGGLAARASVEPLDTDRIRVRLPPRSDVERLMEVATRRGKLEFRIVDESMTAQDALRLGPPANSEVLYGRDDKMPYLVDKHAVITTRDLADAQAGFDPRTQEPIINFKFNSAGARKFARITQENVGHAFAIVIDSVVISAPVIREPILGGAGQISGSFTVQQAIDLAVLLRSGELPGRLSVIEVRSGAP